MPPLAAALGPPQVAESRHAMVVSRHPEASQAGAEILGEGGNAIDAAVAVSMALAVVLPQAGNIGGGGFLLFRGHDGFTTAIDYRETAPAAAHRDLFLDAKGAVDTLRARMGPQSAGVPGTVAGLHLAWSKYGKLPWNRLLAPAIELAEKGFEVNEELSRSIDEDREKLMRYPAAAALLLQNGHPLPPGRRIVQPDLARTLRAIAEQGPQAFYEGDIATAIEAEMRSGGGLITRADLAAYRPIEREVLRGRYRDLEILSMPPPSSGGITLLQILGMAEGFDLEHAEPRLGQPIHLLAEVMSRAFADRNHYLGDPGFVSIPVRGMLAPEYLASRCRSISMDRATPRRFVVHGNPWPFEVRLEKPQAAATDPSQDVFEAGSAGDSTATAPDSSAAPSPHQEPDQTTHVSIVDTEGNVVAMTTTLNGGFGSGVIVGGAGFLLNNEMDDFDARPGAANQFALVGGEANEIAPGKRMLSSMAPTIVLREGRPWLVLGARGGPRIITAIAQVIVSVRDFGADLPAAVAAKRFHHQWLPDVILYEEGAITEAAAQYLRRQGHELRQQPPNPSSLQCIEITKEGLLRGVSDPRTQGAPVGF